MLGRDQPISRLSRRAPAHIARQSSQSKETESVMRKNDPEFLGARHPRALY